MRMLAAALSCLCACMAIAPASAADTGTLDLSLPAAASPYGNDPPGTWYGDTSGVPASPTDASAPVTLSRCPAAADGTPAKLTGSVSAGMGYSSDLGNSNFGAASVNYCDEYTTGSGRSGTVNMRLDMGRYDGPGYYRMPPPGPGPGMGPGPMMMQGGARR